MRYDAIVIGGSYAGLSAAMYIARGRRHVCVVDAGEPRNRFAAESHGFFGMDNQPPLETIAKAREKVLAYPNVTFVSGRAVDAKPVENGFEVALASGESMTASKLVLAFGLTDELPTIPGVQERWGKTVLHCPYCHGIEFGGGRLGVLSVVPMSSHQALVIPDWGATTFFLNGQAPPDEATYAKLRHRDVTVEAVPVAALEGQGTALEGVRLADGRVVALDAIYLAPKTHMASPLAQQLGCAMKEGLMGPVIEVDEKRMTTVPGVYAAGDITQMMGHSSTFASADGVAAGSMLHQALIFEPLAAIQ